MAIDVSTIVTGLVNGLDDVRKGLDTLEPGATLTRVVGVLDDVVPELVPWVAQRLEAGGDPSSELGALLLKTADATAQAVEDAKFPPTEPSTGKG